jgi:pyruvate formate lyase activating enzyme
MKKGRMFNIEKYAIHDGPGIRTTVFFKGCPLRCWWCHNPEGQSPRSELIYRENRCIGCGECVENCTRKALSLLSQHATLNRASCNMCGICSQMCPSEALSVVGKEMSVEEMIKEIERDRVFYDESGGGATFSGGEPLLQPDFLDAILQECNERRIHTTLDTSGYASHEVIDKICGKVDLFLYDIKTMDTANHRKYTGVSNKLILQNLKRLAKNGSNIVISLPIIPRINDDEENILRTGEFISSLPGVEQVSLLPYHRTGVDKYKSLGRPYRLNGIRPPPSQETKMIKERLEAFGLKVKMGGR